MAEATTPTNPRPPRSDWRELRGHDLVVGSTVATFGRRLTAFDVHEGHGRGGMPGRRPRTALAIVERGKRR